MSELVHLTYIRPSDNQISDISPLSGRMNLAFLDLRSNPLNGDAYSIHIPLIKSNNRGIILLYDPQS